MDSPGLLPDPAEPPSSLQHSASVVSQTHVSNTQTISAPVSPSLEVAELVPRTWSLAHLVGIFMAGLTLVLPLLTIMNYSDSDLQSNPSLLLPVDTSPQ